MSIQIGEQVIPQINLGVNRLNKIMLGVIEIFPNLAVEPVLTPISIFDMQENAVTGTNTANIPLDTTGLLPGDTIIVLRRTTFASAPTLTLGSNSFTRQLTRANGGGSVQATVDTLVVPAGLGNTGVVNIVASNPAVLFASIFIARGGSATGLTVLNGASSNMNTASFNSTPTSSNQQNLFIGMGCNPGNGVAVIDSFGVNVPVAANIGTPRSGMTGLACIVDSPAMVTLTQSPIGTGQIIAGVWLEAVPAIPP